MHEIMLSKLVYETRTNKIQQDCISSEVSLYTILFSFVVLEVSMYMFLFILSRRSFLMLLPNHNKYILEFIPQM